MFGNSDIQNSICRFRNCNVIQKQCNFFLLKASLKLDSSLASPSLIWFALYQTKLKAVDFS